MQAQPSIEVIAAAANRRKCVVSDVSRIITARGAVVCHLEISEVVGLGSNFGPQSGWPSHYNREENPRGCLSAGH